MPETVSSPPPAPRQVLGKMAPLGFDKDGPKLLHGVL
jgi:hypothetical protein